LAECPKVDQVTFGIRVDRELPDRKERSAYGEGGNDGVDSRTIGKTRIAERCRLVNASADLTNDLVDNPPKMDPVDKPDVGPKKFPGAFAIDVVWSVNHHFGYVWIVQKRIDRTVPENIGGDFIQKLLPIRGRQRKALLLVDCPLEHLHHTKSQLGVAHTSVVKSGTELLDYLEMETPTKFLDGL
jgi:hypothetical protein